MALFHSSVPLEGPKHLSKNLSGLVSERKTNPSPAGASARKVQDPRRLGDRPRVGQSPGQHIQAKQRSKGAKRGEAGELMD